MRISVNLATRPFVEIRPLLARLRIVMGLLALLAIGLAFGLNSVNARAKVATAEMDSLKARTAAFQQERAADEARMKQPDNQSVLERSQFLNAVFAAKSFSWTAVMMDLERVLPPGLQVTSIDPVVAKTGEVSIRLRVTGDRDRAIQLVRNLETSQRFTSPRLGGESALTSDKANAIGRGASGGVRNVSAGADESFGNGVEFEIFSGYNPLPEKTGKREEGSGTSRPKTGPVAPRTPKTAAPNRAPKPGGAR